MASERENRQIILRIIITVFFFLFSFIGYVAFSQQSGVSGWLHTSIDSILPGSSWGTSGFTLADFDRDGDLDITISRREISGGKVFWYENQSGTWRRHDLGLSDEEQLGAVTTDINGDGYSDLVVARYWFENPKVLDRFPDSAWIRHSYAGGLLAENHDIIACDFNSDGKQEILCYSQKTAGGTLRLYNTADPYNWSYRDVSDAANATVSNIAGSNGVHGGFAPNGVGDLDGDEYADIVMPAGWYKNPGKNQDGTWQYHPWPFRTGITPNLYGISIRSWVTDLDSDGDNDVVYTDCDVEGSEGYWIENKGTGMDFIRHALASPGDPTGSFHSLAVVDFDRDGDLDIFTGEQEDPDAGMKPKSLKERGFIWENTGSRRKPSFVVRIIQTDNPGWHDIQTGDVDGDGDLDIVSKIWNKDGKYYHVDYWENQVVNKSAQFRKSDDDPIKRKWLDIAYATASQAQKLDIYLPDEGEGPFPVILSIHGGAFRSGDKGDGQVNAMLEGLKRGYGVVSINYRLSGEAIFPAQIFDVKAAVRWIRANAKQYRLNPDKIAAWGSSAGGHLSALLGTSGSVEELEDLTLGNIDQSSRVQAVVDWFGPTDFLKMDEQLKESNVSKPMKHSIPESPESELIGKNLDDAPELVRAANPETYITPDDPSFFIQHGMIDNLVPYQQSVNLAKKLETVIGKDKVAIELLPDSGHGGPGFQSEQNIDKVFVFLDRTLK
jgi:acetyl esterase/lipase